jgi:hypothetical protein
MRACSVSLTFRFMAEGFSGKLLLWASQRTPDGSTDLAVEQRTVAEHKRSSFLVVQKTNAQNIFVDEIRPRPQADWKPCVAFGARAREVLRA